MQVLSVQNLCKRYEAFELKNVSFELKEGTITGFIGRNGAGKTTTLKSLLNFVHKDSGEILFFGKRFEENEFEIKQKIGFVSGGISYYPKKKLKTISMVNKRFYENWDDAAYRRYMKMFKLEEEKTPEQLSEGMKVKYSLALALSHNASLLILDEPTSGLDPVSRDDLLDVFMNLVEKEKITIFFSTHITSDLEKCADNITYIKNGEIIQSIDLNSFLAQYKAVQLEEDQLTRELEQVLIGCKKNRNGYSAIIKTSLLPMNNLQVSDVNLETVMIHMEKED